MKQFKLTFVLTVIMSMVGLEAFADWDTLVGIDGLYYYLDDTNNQAQVTFTPAFYGKKYTGDIVITPNIENEGKTYSVTRIGESAFSGCTDLTSVTIPNSVTSISSYAFLNCSGLTSVTIGNSVTSIGNYAFYGCSGLTSVTIPNSVTSIGQKAFYGCYGLTSVTAESETPVTITSTVFYNRTNATLYVPYGCKAAYEATDYWKDFKEIIEMAAPNIVFADANVKALCVANWDTNGDGELSKAEAAAVTKLGEVFYGKAITSFNELQYFTGLTYIYSFAFSDCSGLTSVTIPNSVTSIGWGAFVGCYGLTSVTIPNSVTSIGQSAFEGCSGLTSITIPNSVTSIGINAFRSCTNLTSITVESGNTNYDSRDNCNAIIETASNTLIAGCKNTRIPNSVTSIGDLAFSDCTGLTSVTIPNSVTTIGEYNQEIKGETNVEIIPVIA